MINLVELLCAVLFTLAVFRAAEWLVDPSDEFHIAPRGWRLIAAGGAAGSILVQVIFP